MSVQKSIIASYMVIGELVQNGYELLKEYGGGYSESPIGY